MKKLVPLQCLSAEIQLSRRWVPVARIPVPAKSYIKAHSFMQSFPPPGFAPQGSKACLSLTGSIVCPGDPPAPANYNPADYDLGTQVPIQRKVTNGI